MRAQLTDERNPPHFPSIVLKQADDPQSRHQANTCPKPKWRTGRRRRRKREEGGLTKEVRITSERVDGDAAGSDADFVPKFLYNGSDGACHDPEEGKIKV